jgi:hypothetical protein
MEARLDNRGRAVVRDEPGGIEDQFGAQTRSGHDRPEPNEEAEDEGASVVLPVDQQQGDRDEIAEDERDHAASPPRHLIGEALVDWRAWSPRCREEPK